MEPDKRYLLFLYDLYGAMGGLNDMMASFDTPEEAADYAKKKGYDFSRIYDRVEGLEIDVEMCGG